MTKTRPFNTSLEWTPISDAKSQEVSSVLRSAVQPHEKYIKRFRKAYESKVVEAPAAAASARAKKRAKKMAKLAAKLKQKQAALAQVNAKLSAEQLGQLKRSVLTGYFFKRHFRFGINTITKILENSQKCAECLFVLVFPANSPPSGETVVAETPATTESSNQKKNNATSKKQPAVEVKQPPPSRQTTDAPSVSDLNQFNFLTRHIRMMCTDLDVPAGCLSAITSSSFLSKFFSMNRISVLALMSRSDENRDELPSHVAADLAKLSAQHGLIVESGQPNQLLDFYKSNKAAIDRDVQAAVESIGAAVRSLLPKLEVKSNFDKFLTLAKMVEITASVGSELSAATNEAPMQLEPVLMSDSDVGRQRRGDDSGDEVFGADFINVDRDSKSLATRFDDANFILINK